MPITSSALKASRQARDRKARRQPVKTTMKTMMRKVTTAVASGNKAEAQKYLPVAYKAIDMAAKKHIIHPKNAARKKSGIAKIVSAMK
jgi:small subunit ribosomal protein S20